MFWVLLAVAAHAGNALVFVVDKSLLGGKSRVSDPLRYTFYSAALAGAAVVLLALDYVPLTMFVVGWSALAAVLYVAALWVFFAALKKGEPSRVVPISGSAVPAFTLLLAATFLGEVLSGRHWLAVLLLLAGGVLLSVRWRGVKGLSAGVLAGAVASGLLFAGYYAVMKHVYMNTDSFLAVFAYSRVVQAVLAVGVFGSWLLLSRRGVRDFYKIPPNPPLSRGALIPAGKRAPLDKGGQGGVGGRRGVLAVVFIANKTLAAGAFILLNWAISLGSVTVANALQGTQYMFLLLLAAAVSVWWPKLFREELSRVAVWQKVGGIGLISLGVALLV